MELLIRFLIGGTLVSAFAMVGDGLKPKSFAGIFGAAPSVALATLLLTVHQQGRQYAAVEGRSMLIGALATLVYVGLCARLMWTSRRSTAFVTISMLLVWLAGAMLGWWILIEVTT